MTQHSPDYLAGFRAGAEAMQKSAVTRIVEIAEALHALPRRGLVAAVCSDASSDAAEDIAAAIRSLPLPTPEEGK